MTDIAERASSGFPNPVLTLACGPIFSRAQVAAWWADYQTRPQHVSALHRREKP